MLAIDLRGKIDATLHGELGTILGWIEAQVIERLGNDIRAFRLLGDLARDILQKEEIVR